MTIRHTAFAPGTPCWVDVSTSDPERALGFYRALFGWTVEQEAGVDSVWTFRSDGAQVAGMITVDDAQRAEWMTYVGVDNVEATLRAARSAGAATSKTLVTLGELGRTASILDPVGGSVGLWEPGRRTGFEKYNDTGSVTWDELHSNDFVASLSFYREVFGWEYQVESDTDAFRYRMAQVGGATVAGVQDAAVSRSGSGWVVYFAVDDVDESAGRLEALGGRVLEPAADTPYGRVAKVRDPAGASFILHSMKLGAQ